MKFTRKKRNIPQKTNVVPEAVQCADGQTLAQRLALRGVLAETDVLPILSQLLRELQALHAVGAFYLGLCPESVVVGKDGKVHLSDTGKWKALAVSDAEMPRLRPSGFAALELQGRRMESVGPWTDFYALGATLYSLLTLARVPELTMILGEGEDAFEFPDEVSDRMRALILHLMQPNRRQRPQSVDDLKDWILPEAEPAAEEPAEEAPAAEVPAENPAAAEAPAEEPAAEPSAEEEEAPAESELEIDDDDDDDEHHWYNLEREDLMTLLFVMGFTAILLLYKAFV